MHGSHDARVVVGSQGGHGDEMAIGRKPPGGLPFRKRVGRGRLARAPLRSLDNRTRSHGARPERQEIFPVLLLQTFLARACIRRHAPHSCCAVVNALAKDRRADEQPRAAFARRSASFHCFHRLEAA